MHVRWPAVFLVLGLCFGVWLLAVAGAAIARAVGRFLDVILLGAERDPVFAFGLLAMVLISVLGALRLILGNYRDPKP